MNGNWTYTYDQFNRLASSSKNAGAQTFSYDYDRYGNRWHQNAPQGGPAPQYAMDSSTNRISGSGVTYDALGNVTNDGLGNAYYYDAESRLIKVVNSGGTYNYTYDADGRRIKNASTEFVYDLAGRATTLFNATTGTWNYGEIYAGGRHLATYSGGTTNFIHNDWLGTKRVMTSVSGTNSETCTGLPFGDGVNCTGTNWTFNGFTDDIHDSETNLEHTWFRQLNTTQGRWMRPDPYLGSMNLANPQTWNRYAYAANNPCNAVDLLGLDTCTFDIQINNKAGLTDSQLAELEARINAVLGSATSNGNSVQAQFSFTGKPDFTVNISSWRNWLGDGYSGWPFFSSWIFWGNIKSYANATTYGGTAAAHEIVHRGAGPRFDLWGSYNGSPNLMNVNQAQAASNKIAAQVSADWTNPVIADNSFASLSRQQIQKLFNKCAKAHPPNNPSGGGGGSDVTALGGGGGWSTIGDFLAWLDSLSTLAWDTRGQVL